MTSVSIPLSGGDEELEIPIDELPAASEIVEILAAERPPVKVWLKVACAYDLKGGEPGAFETIVKQAQADLSTAMGFGATPAHTAVAVDSPAVASQPNPPRVSTAPVDVENPFASPLTGDHSGQGNPVSLRRRACGLPALPLSAVASC